VDCQQRVGGVEREALELQRSGGKCRLADRRYSVEHEPESERNRHQSGARSGCSLMIGSRISN